LALNTVLISVECMLLFHYFFVLYFLFDETILVEFEVVSALTYFIRIVVAIFKAEDVLFGIPVTILKLGARG